jgi:hypothetical protein
MPVVFDEVTAEVEPPSPPPAEEAQAGHSATDEPFALKLRRELRRQEKRQARLRAD